MKKFFLTIVSILIVLNISSCQKDEMNNEYNDSEMSREIISPKKVGGDRVKPTVDVPIKPITPPIIDRYQHLISTFSNDTFYSNRFDFSSHDFMTDTISNDRLYLFEALDKEYYFLCVRITSNLQISESYIIDFTDGMDFDLYMEVGVPIPFDVYTVDDTFAFSAELDLENGTFSIINYNREMVDPDQPTSNTGSVFCNVAMYTAALPWTTGLAMIGGPWGWGLSLLVGLSSTVVSTYICN